jgi:diphthamide biosynthesis methyltransferase
VIAIAYSGDALVYTTHVRLKLASALENARSNSIFPAPRGLSIDLRG